MTNPLGFPTGPEHGRCGSHWPAGQRPRLPNTLPPPHTDLHTPTHTRTHGRPRAGPTLQADRARRRRAPPDCCGPAGPPAGGRPAEEGDGRGARVPGGAGGQGVERAGAGCARGRPGVEGGQGVEGQGQGVGGAWWQAAAGALRLPPTAPVAIRRLPWHAFALASARVPCLPNTLLHTLCCPGPHCRFGLARRPVSSSPPGPPSSLSPLPPNLLRAGKKARVMFAPPRPPLPSFPACTRSGLAGGPCHVCADVQVPGRQQQLQRRRPGQRKPRAKPLAAHRRQRRRRRGGGGFAGAERGKAEAADASVVRPHPMAAGARRAAPRRAARRAPEAAAVRTRRGHVSAPARTFRREDSPAAAACAYPPHAPAPPPPPPSAGQGATLHQLAYGRAELTISDHRPVAAAFLLQAHRCAAALQRHCPPLPPTSLLCCCCPCSSLLGHPLPKHTRMSCARLSMPHRFSLHSPHHLIPLNPLTPPTLKVRPRQGGGAVGGRAPLCGRKRHGRAPKVRVWLVLGGGIGAGAWWWDWGSAMLWPGNPRSWRRCGPAAALAASDAIHPTHSSGPSSRRARAAALGPLTRARLAARAELCATQTHHRVSVEPKLLDFGLLPYGQPRTLSFALANEGAVPASWYFVAPPRAQGKGGGGSCGGGGGGRRVAWDDEQPVAPPWLQVVPGEGTLGPGERGGRMACRAGRCAAGGSASEKLSGRAGACGAGACHVRPPFCRHPPSFLRSARPPKPLPVVFPAPQGSGARCS